jgi:tRNA(Ile)-lysidine synthase
MSSTNLVQRIERKLAELVADAARDNGEDPGAAGVLVALSGGPDSVALLDVAARWARREDRPIIAMHVDHQLRGSASRQDAAFCAELCARLEIELVTVRVDARGVARHRGRGIEEAARQLRLDALEDVRCARGLTAIATGHHRDDQVETVILRLFRGTGLDGLRGIRPRRGRVIHPLLAVSRVAIAEYLTAQGLKWCDDASNADGSNRRGRVRHELLPLIRDIFGLGAGDSMARLAELADADLGYLEERSDHAWRAVQTEPPDGLVEPVVSATALASLPAAIARRVIRRWLGEALPTDLELVHVDEIRRWLADSQSGTGLDLPGGVRIERVFDALGVVGEPPPVASVETWRVAVEPLDAVPDPVPPPRRDPDGWRLVCAADALHGAVRLRHPRAGERLEPFGLGGSKKLSDLCQERRIPGRSRSGLLLVEDDRGPLWVLGIVQDERTRVLPTTRQAVTIFVSRRRQEGGR